MADNFYLKDNFLGDQNPLLLRFVLSLQTLFQPSATTNDTLNNNTAARKSKVIFEKDFPKFAMIFRERLQDDFTEICKRLGFGIFDLDHIEIQLTAHNHGDFYKPHIDKGSKQNSARAITFVYYFHSIPKMFGGGQLLLLQQPVSVIEPTNDSIVFFDPAITHAVHPINCETKAFEHSRFSINGWFHRKSE